MIWSTGEFDVERYFNAAKRGLTRLARINNLDPNEALVKKFCGRYGEAQGHYVFCVYDVSNGLIPPGGFVWTVNQETGEFECTRLERVSLRPPWAPTVGYKELGRFPDSPMPD